MSAVKRRLWGLDGDSGGQILQIQIARIFLQHRTKNSLSREKNCSGLFVFLSTNHNHLVQHKGDMRQRHAPAKYCPGGFCMRGGEAAQRKR